jgi:hypothetical protein
MTEQPHLFHCGRDVRTVQRGLFDGKPIELDRCCPECDRRRIVTPSGWACCPAGHGKLMPLNQG